jgi:hypothetical protein
MCVENGGATLYAPVIEVPGETPTSPAVMEFPLPAKVTPEPPRTAKLCASPSDWASVEEGAQRSAAKATLATRIRCLPFTVNLAFPRPKISRS